MSDNNVARAIMRTDFTNAKYRIHTRLRFVVRVTLQSDNGVGHIFGAVRQRIPAFPANVDKPARVHGYAVELTR